MSRVLIVEDDAGVRSTLRHIVQRAGHIVEDARDGEQCLQRLPAFRPHLMLLDILMPARDGLETLMTLRRSGSRVPVIAMSGGGRMAEQAPLLKTAALMGAVATLKKPVRALDLLRAVEQWSMDDDPPQLQLQSC